MKDIEKVLVYYSVVMYTMDLPIEFVDEIPEFDYSVENC